MAYQGYSLPVRLRVESDGSLNATLATVDASFQTTFNRGTQAATEAARQINRAFQSIQSPRFDPAGLTAAAAAAERLAVEQRQLATAANIAATAADGATEEQRQLATAMNQAATAAENEAARVRALAIAQTNVAKAAEVAGLKLATANDNVTSSVRGQRFATIQASQQIQDFSVQLLSGQNALVAFSQQASQMAFVLQDAGGKVGRIATFLSGPFGTAVLIGITVVGLLTNAFSNNKDAAEDADKAAKDFADRQNDLKNFIDATTGKLIEQNAALVRNAVLLREKTIQENREKVKEGTKSAFDAAATASFGGRFNEIANTIGRGTGEVPVPQDRDILNAIRSANGDVVKLDDSLARLAKRRPELSDLIRTISTAAGEGIVLARENKKLEQEIAALEGNTNATFTNPAAVQGLVAIASATDQYSRRIAELREQRRKLDDDVSGGRFKGDRDAYIEAASAIDQQIEAQQELASAAKKSGRETSKAAKDAGREIASLRSEVGRMLESLNLFEESSGVWRRITPEIQAARRAAEAFALVQEAVAKGAISASQAAAAEKAIALDLASIRSQERARQEKPFNDLSLGIERQAEIQQALIAGDERRAEILDRAYQIQDQLNTAQAKEAVTLEDALELATEIVDAEYARTRAIEQRQRLIDIQVQAARDIQSALTDFIANPFGKGSLNNLTKAFADIRKNLFAEQLSVRLFGDLGGDLRDALTRGSGPFGPAVVELRQSGAAVKEGAKSAGEAIKAASEQSGANLNSAADRLTTAAGAIESAASRLGGSGGPSVSQLATTPTAFGAAGNALASAAFGTIGGSIASGARGLAGAIGGFAGSVSSAAQSDPRVKATVKTNSLLEGIQGFFNKTFGSNADVALAGVASLAGGKIGGIGNAVLNARTFASLGKTLSSQISGSLGGALGAALGNAGNGLISDSVVKALGIKGSSTGGALGGAAGGAIGNLILPGVGGVVGSFIGGALGSITGGLFKSNKKPLSRSYINEMGGDLWGQKSDTSVVGEATGIIQSSIQRIAESLGASVGSYGLTFGMRDGEYRVSGNYGADVVKKNPGAADGIIYRGQDEEAAVRAAILNAIQDGAIKGISDATKRLLSAGTDFDAALQKATDFQSIFTRLKEYTDPVGAALERVNTEFDYLRKVAAEAGASMTELAQLEQLYQFERKAAIESAAQDLTSTLEGLLSDLTYRGDSGLSLGTRQANALAAFNPLAAQVASGQAVDQEEFDETARALLEIQREIYGSTQEYFNSLDAITALTRQAITNAGGTAPASGTSVAVAALTGTQSNAVVAAQAANDNAGSRAIVNTGGIESRLDEVVKRLDRLVDIGASAPATRAPQPVAATAIPSAAARYAFGLR